MADSPVERHAFLSYMHENREQVDELQEALEALGIVVWRDTANLWPGEDWEAKIRSAIKNNSMAFVACFSSAAEEREKSYQYEELTLAVEEYRLRPPSSSWLFTVRFDDCVIPDYPLGGGRTLATTIHRADLFGKSRTVNIIRLTESVRRIVNPSVSAPTTAGPAAAALSASGTSRQRSDQLKLLLRDPAADIALEDFMGELATSLSDVLNDDELFPIDTKDQSWPGLFTAWRKQVDAYEAAIAPALELVRLAATYGQPEHAAAWERFMGRLTPRLDISATVVALAELRGYPVLVLMYVVAIASEARHNYAPMRSFVATPRVRSTHRPGHTNPLPLQINARSIVEDVEPFASALALSDDGVEITDGVITELVEKRRGARFTPLSDHLHAFLRELFRGEVAADSEYDQIFDRAEVLLDAVAMDASNDDDGWYGAQGGYGRYTWRHRRGYRGVEAPEASMLTDARKHGDAWGPVVAGLFGGSGDRAVSALTRVVEIAESVRRSQR